MESSISEIGPWKRIRVLGSGGFGQVTLWYNENTDQNIAIKKLHEQILRDDNSRGKQIERWCKEVEIMKKLNHINIISTLKISEEFQKLSSLPVLIMEYCSLGDLRRMLNKPENCSGLEESAILNILKDVSNGLAYLHCSKIIHRDLKPDNIVLQSQDFKIVYKLIDLGYAKAFDQNSLSQSFVGTIQYIAPELFLGKAYTSSVDYWSFGLLTYEIITGHRPFLPGFNPSDWMRQIQNKTRNIISVLENANGDIVFSSTISKKNRIASCYLNDIEKWLQLALDWDGQTRGRDSNKNRPIIFEELGNILSKKVIRVFSMFTYETFAYEINSETDISDLRKWLKADTNLDIGNQVLLMPSGKSLNSKGSLLDSLKDEYVPYDKPSIFLYNNGLIVIKDREKIISETSRFVEELIDLSQRTLRYRHLKRCCADLIWFLQMEAVKYKNLLYGIEIKVANTKNKTLAIESLYEEVGDEWNQIENYSQFLSFSHKIDLESYINLRKAGKLKASPLVKKWIQNVIEVDKKVTELKASFNKNEQKQLVLGARQRYRNLDNHPCNANTQRTVFDEIVDESYKLWENIQKLSREGKDFTASNIEAVNLINKMTKEATKFSSDETLQSLFLKISEADENLARFLTHLTILSKSMKILKLVIENTQKERQKEIWNLIENVKEIPGKENKKILENIETHDYKLSNLSDLISDNKKNDTNGEVRAENKKEAQKKSDFYINYKSNFNSTLSLQDSLDASSIINDNNQLRYSMKDVQQNLAKIVKDFTSLDWDLSNE